VAKIKTIHIITRMDKGGSAENTLLTVKGLDKSVYDVTLINGLSFESMMTSGESKAVEESLADAQKNGIRVITMPELVREIRPLSDLKSLYHLTRILKRECPHIVHTHTSKTGILGRWAAWIAGIPIVIHTPHGHVFWGYFNKLKTAFFIFLERISASITDRIIVLTEQEKRDHLTVRIGAESKFILIHSGVDLSKFMDGSVESEKMKRALNITRDNFIVGTAGRLTPIKGHRFLIKAAKEIVARQPNVTFVFLGDGELRDSLEALANEMDLKESMRFLGWRNDVADVMSTFDVFVLPSINEGMGRVLVEAMILGKPVVAYDIGGIPDLVIHGDNGFLVPAGDVNGLSSRISELLTDSIKRKTMGERGRKRASYFSADEMVLKIDQLYRTLATEKGIV
jgi:glycosyltransferase involved in cell wall biosynthesis